MNNCFPLSNLAYSRIIEIYRFPENSMSNYDGIYSIQIQAQFIVGNTVVLQKIKNVES